MTITGRIEGWALFGNAIYGKIYDDVKHRWEDGHVIKLARLVPADQMVAEGRVVTTKNSRYLFGRPAGLEDI